MWKTNKLLVPSRRKLGIRFFTLGQIGQVGSFSTMPGRWCVLWGPWGISTVPCRLCGVWTFSVSEAVSRNMLHPSLHFSRLPCSGQVYTSNFLWLFNALLHRNVRVIIASTRVFTRRHGSLDDLQISKALTVRRYLGTVSHTRHSGGHWIWLL